MRLLCHFSNRQRTLGPAVGLGRQLTSQGKKSTRTLLMKSSMVATGRKRYSRYWLAAETRDFSVSGTRHRPPAVHVLLRPSVVQYKRCIAQDGVQRPSPPLPLFTTLNSCASWQGATMSFLMMFGGFSGCSKRRSRIMRTFAVFESHVCWGYRWPAGGVNSSASSREFSCVLCSLPPALPDVSDLRSLTPATSGETKCRDSQISLLSRGYIARNIVLTVG